MDLVGPAGGGIDEPTDKESMHESRCAGAYPNANRESRELSACGMAPGQQCAFDSTASRAWWPAHGGTRHARVRSPPTLASDSAKTGRRGKRHPEGAQRNPDRKSTRL